MVNPVLCNDNAAKAAELFVSLYAVCAAAPVLEFTTLNPLNNPFVEVDAVTDVLAASVVTDAAAGVVAPMTVLLMPVLVSVNTSDDAPKNRRSVDPTGAYIYQFDAVPPERTTLNPTLPELVLLAFMSASVVDSNPLAVSVVTDAAAGVVAPRVALMPEALISATVLPLLFVKKYFSLGFLMTRSPAEALTAIDPPLSIPMTDWAELRIRFSCTPVVAPFVIVIESLAPSVVTLAAAGVVAPRTPFMPEALTVTMAESLMAR